MTVSVITIVKEDPNGLRATVKSLTDQTSIEWQLIIVPGYSRDQTKSTAFELSSTDARITVIEQNNDGIYDAMNLGLSVAKGDYVWFMNAGDIFYSPEVLGEALIEITNSNVDLLIGGYQINHSRNLKKYVFRRKSLTAWEFAFNRRGGCHQAMLFRTATLIKLGGFDTSFKLASDFGLVLKLLQEYKGLRIDQVYASIEPGGRSDQGINLVHREKHKIRTKVMPGLIMSIVSFNWALGAIMKIYTKKIFIKTNRT
jgi:glycosyltransferase involved in cell wall biosynthesis